MRDERNELIRKILGVCGACPHGQKRGRGLVCGEYPSRCHSKMVKKWVKDIERLEGIN